MKMDNIFTPQRTVKFFIVSVIGTTIAALIIWPLFDMLFDQISGKTFSYDVMDHVVWPIVFSIIINVLEFVFWNFFHKKSK